MSFKPADLLLGIVDLFAFLIPGALVTYAFASPIFRDFNPTLSKLGGSPPPDLSGLDWAILILVSYVAGTFLQSISGQILNPLFSTVYAPLKLNRYSKLDSWVKSRIADAYGGEGDTIDWADVAVRIREPSLAPAIDKLDAVAKLFRGISVLLVCFAVYRLTQGNTSEAAVAFLLFLLALWRFWHQRWRRQLFIYQCYRTLFPA